jgi:hypothetical protein
MNNEPFIRYVVEPVVDSQGNLSRKLTPVKSKDVPAKSDRHSTDINFTPSQIETIARAIARDEIKSHERRFLIQGAIALLSLSAIGELFRRVTDLDGLKYFLSNLHNL